LPNTTLNQKKINKKKKGTKIGYKPFDLYVFDLTWLGWPKIYKFDHKPNQKSWFDPKTNQKQNHNKKNILNLPKTQEIKKKLSKMNQTHQKMKNNVEQQETKTKPSNMKPTQTRFGQNKRHTCWKSSNAQ